jgi:hypothetical protein
MAFINSMFSFYQAAPQAAEKGTEEARKDTKSAFQNLGRQVQCERESDGIWQFFLHFSSAFISLSSTLAVTLRSRASL